MATLIQQQMEIERRTELAKARQMARENTAMRDCLTLWQNGYDAHDTSEILEGNRIYHTLTQQQQQALDLIAANDYPAQQDLDQVEIALYDGDDELWAGTLAQFLKDNQDDPLPVESVAAMKGLDTGDTCLIGMGAGGCFTVERVG